MLMGTYEHRLDTKARLVLPAKIREKLSDAVVAAAGLENCVSLYSETEWENFSEKIKNMPFYSDDENRDFVRIMLSSAHEIFIDGMGRVLLPQVLREYARLNQEVVVNGVRDHVEIWDKELWATKWKSGLENLPKLAKNAGF
ncbi:MAG: division/cell wall cluster transcriptional repressor MraZ [Synergistaceae bacterium]|jgi:MraZ protein|nr:division/cell wall cluster transcriptional repressor MraZ [Synergistaceae bacterium]